jgi:hypothetical protein
MPATSGKIANGEISEMMGVNASNDPGSFRGMVVADGHRSKRSRFAAARGLLQTGLLFSDSSGWIRYQPSDLILG